MIERLFNSLENLANYQAVNFWIESRPRKIIMVGDYAYNWEYVTLEEGLFDAVIGAHAHYQGKSPVKA